MEDEAASQEKMILEQFQMIYDQDPQLREVIGPEAASLNLEEKYQILNAYMQGGGVQGLLAAGEDEGGEVDSEDERAIEDEFNAIYQADAELR